MKMQIGMSEIATRLGLFVGVMLAGGPVFAHGSIGRLTIGAKVVSPCTIATPPRNNAGAELHIVCDDALHSRPQVVGKAGPIYLGDTANKPTDLKQDDVIPSYTEIVF